tara:strand:+ start:472 stop:846 length:375 start_codon:yes stop_codon:yes gene_type:complete
MEGSIMGQIRHGCAPTTQAIKATIQRSQAMNAAPSREDGINVKTVAKWRERETLDNRKTGLTELGLTELGLTEPGLTVLNPAEETMVVALGVIRCFRLMIACMLCNLLAQNVPSVSDKCVLAHS